MAEFNVGGTWYFAEAFLRRESRRFVLTRLTSDHWLRRWQTLPHRRLAQFRVPGSATVNTLNVDWGFMAQSFAKRRNPGTTFTVAALDGYITGFERIFVYTCHVHSSEVDCENAFGDAIRYHR